MTDRQLASFLSATVIVGKEACWPWLRSVDAYGYGKLRNRGAHRVAYEHFIGPVPEGMQLDHVCRVRSCVNPWHLEPVTVGENIRRGHQARGVAGGREDRERRSLARRRYEARKRHGLPGPQPGESREAYHARIDPWLAA